MKRCGHCNTAFGSLAILVIALIPAGAALGQTTEDTFELPLKPKWNEAAVYFFRDSKITDSSGHVGFYVNDLRVCDLLRDQYSGLIVPPGEFTITSRQSMQTGPTTLSSGSKWKNAFAKYMTSDGGFAPGRTCFITYQVRTQIWANQTVYTLKSVRQAEALPVLAKLAYREPDMPKLVWKAATPDTQPRRSGESSETGVVPRNSGVQPASDASVLRGPSSMLDTLPRGAKPTIPIDPQPMFLLDSSPGAWPPKDESSK